MTDTSHFAGMHAPFGEFALLLLICAVAGAVFVRLRQPLVIGFIAVGILAGPSGWHWIQGRRDQIHLLAQVGVAVLLFVVGLELDLHHIRHLGRWRWPPGWASSPSPSSSASRLVLALGKAGWRRCTWRWR